MLERENKFYAEHQVKFKEKYPNKWLVIVGESLWGVYDKALKDIPVKIEALWDTGATLTFIKPQLRDRLKLRMFRTGSSISIAGVGGLVKADFTVCLFFSI